MEQSGRPGAVHMTAESAAQLHREGTAGAPRPPLHPTEIKSKGTMLTAWLLPLHTHAHTECKSAHTRTHTGLRARTQERV